MKKLNAAISAAFFLLSSYHLQASEAPWLDRAQLYVGAGPQKVGVKRRSLWCAEGLNQFLRMVGIRGTNSAMASSFARYGSSVSGPKRGAIAVMSRGKRGGHVGIVMEDKGKYVKVLSANHGGRVGIGLYPKSRIYSYRWPNDARYRVASMNGF